MTNKKIAIIEDDEDIRLSLEELLQDQGFEVLSASNGQKGLDLLRGLTEMPRLILLDLMMPVMDGYTFRVEQKKDAKIAQIPVVVMTADGQAAFRKEKLDGAELLKKPVDIDTILKTVNKYY